ncbi:MULTISPECIES: ribosome hibernation-promoting factor, HPF/YfiA family [Shewanella]|jgi:ribosome-associated inhibitor A|uniref:Ribosomal subunit interface protein n=3 Tax=Shewanella putrefaciens TaxID=24 RepID=E6XID0_SHEP2|nr:MULTISPECIES: ribosome-associated translation inhibitor RaiA [Shewanella]CAD6363735.1 Ribosome-associated inhibitor A [Shewanella hafniensis]ABM24115.1 sigma 54 modulation protein / SSU ribosomal protein S30P [Shewanella sp. W3-18-1]AVV85815.1 30S ribosomal protein S30 [Shewanella putrefaciens]MCK7629571.1 ribosome-associated translation inhibitor RaiA [Shewanella sp. JNE9-1]MCK7632879.1 ribosome-associated translation inhibitor RaiA [Shewanella sp. JNE17]
MLKITSKQLEVTAPIRERIESRFEKLSRHDVQLINPHVIITEEKPGFKIEASVGIPNGELFAQAKHENLYAAITAMGQKLEKQLNRLTHKPEAQRFASLVHTDTDDVDAIDEYEEEDAA